MLSTTYSSSSSLRSLAKRIINFAGPSRPLDRSSAIRRPAAVRSASTATAWPSKTHMKKKMGIPPPLPAIYPQQVVLADGSTFTMYTTAPTPSVIRLTRDVTNNPLWAPGSDKKGVGAESEEGRVGRFKKRFEGMTSAAEEESTNELEQKQEGSAQAAAAGAAPKKAAAQFGQGDLDWMSEGAVEEKVSARQMGGAKPSKKK